MVDVMVENIHLVQKKLMSLQEGHAIWTSEESVQQWINTIEQRSNEISEPTSPTKSSFDCDVFLQLPGGDTEELALGAEARHYGHLSPRLSPLVSFEKEEGSPNKENDDLSNDKFPNNNNNNNDEPYQNQETSIKELDQDFESGRLEDLKQFLQQQKAAATAVENDEHFFTPISIQGLEQTPPRRSNSLTSQDTFSSFSSSVDKPSSLAAFLRPDPEELLFSLGFCNQDSLLQSIPERFFVNQSEAYGINVEEIHNSLLIDDQESELAEPASPHSLLHRFSESSIDLHDFNSITSSTESSLPVSLTAKTRRILFRSSHQDIPSIHLTRDEDRPLSPTSLSLTSSSGNFMRLETLKELPEPSSRLSSFDIDVPLTPVNKSIRSRLTTSCSVSEISRKLSDTDLSRGGTLVDEETEQNHFVSNSLQMPNVYKRTLSDKSFSSLVTVIDRSGTEDSSAETTNNEALFKPISSNEMSSASFDDSFSARHESTSSTRNESSSPRNHSHSSETQAGFRSPKTGSQSPKSHPSSPSLSAANRRSLFGSSKNISKTNSSTDHVFSSGETAIRTTTKPEHLTVTETLINEEITEVTNFPKPIMDLNDARKASLNDSFKDFIKNLASDSSINGSSHNGSPVPPHSTENDEQIDIIMNEENAEETNLNIDIQSPVSSELDEELSNENTPQEQFTNGDIVHSPEPTNPPKQETLEASLASVETQKAEPNSNITQNKKGYFSAAFNSISNVFNKYQDSKQSSVDETLPPVKNEQDAESENLVDKKEESSSIPTKSQPNKKQGPLFRLFNHQTLSMHSNSAFSSFVSGLSNGVEVELDRASDISIEVSQTSSKLTTNQPKASSVSPLGDSLSSDENVCDCPKSPDRNSSKSRRYGGKKSPHFNKGRSLESSGFEEETNNIKCPFGKNCSLGHKNGRHVYPVENNDRLSIRKGSEASSMMRSCSPTSTYFTHEHFDYLVQQMTYLRAELKEEFQQSITREKKMKEHFESQLDDMKKTMTTDYMGWIANEMKQLKTKLHEKDEEIRRLRDIIAENEAQASKTKRRESFGTPV
ncbi:serine-rich adhesin for platelets-like [Clytia hemisphaerica]|uniref:ITPR-interacting domain-containing protein n=1 Tax=Clytia hemisphaerica TaxID=252671 RepID=A0A7M5VB24_9CNID|eukprot:TCONS_00057680-protein